MVTPYEEVVMQFPIMAILAVLAIFLFLRGGTWGPLAKSEFSQTERFWKVVSLMETNGMRSNLYLYYNNLFGMNFAKVRETTATHALASGFAVYASPRDSVADIVLYMRAMGYPKNFTSLRQMVEFMGSKGYYGQESPDDYYAKCEAWANREGVAV